MYKQTFTDKGCVGELWFHIRVVIYCGLFGDVWRNYSVEQLETSCLKQDDSEFKHRVKRRIL